MLWKVKSYLEYHLKAKHLHGVHSPFVYALSEQVFSKSLSAIDLNRLDLLRGELERSDRLINIEDFGAGGLKRREYRRSVSSLAKKVAKSKKAGLLLYRLCYYLKPKTMLELGTSLGLSAAYQYMGAKSQAFETKMMTLEGATEVAELARQNFKTLDIADIGLKTGPFEVTLEQACQTLKQLDWVFMDGNHQYAPTLSYFECILKYAHEGTCIVLDDIHWSLGMEQAWKDIYQRPEVSVSIDLWDIGLVFLHPHQAKEHFVLRYY